MLRCYYLLVMSGISFIHLFTSWLNTKQQALASVDTPTASGKLYQSQAAMQEDKKKFFQLIDSEATVETAVFLAQALDKNQTRASDLDVNNLPVALLEHLGEDFSDREKLINIEFKKFLDFFQDLVKFGYEHKAEPDYQREINSFITTVFTYIESIHEKAKSLAVLKPLMDLGTQLQNEAAVLGDDFNKYLKKCSIDLERFAKPHNADQQRLLEYDKSLLSKSNRELLENFSSPDETKVFEIPKFASGLIESVCDGSCSISDFNRSYLDFALAADENLDDNLVSNLIVLREFIRFGYDKTKTYQSLNIVSESE